MNQFTIVVLITMSERPQRLAKTNALNVIYGHQSDSSDSDLGVEEDDVAFQREINVSDGDDLYEIQQPESDEDILLEDQVVILSGDEENEMDSEGDESETSDATFVSPNGIEWKNSNQSTGRENTANVFAVKRGFLPGIRPCDEREAFLSIFHNLVDIALLNTNECGRRFHRESTLSWKPIDDDEMLAFLGKYSIRISLILCTLHIF